MQNFEVPGGFFMNIVSTAKLSEKHQARLQEKYPQYHFSFFDQMEKVSAQSLQEVQILATYGEDLDATLVQKMPNLQWIHVLSAGLEKMPLQELHDRNILVTNARGIHGIQMAEYTLGMILNLVRKSYTFYDNHKQGIWDRTTIRLDEAYGKTVGILGLGSIGTEIAKRAKAFGMRVLALRRQTGETPEYVDKLVSYENKSELFSESDFLVVLLPVTPETVHFVGEIELQLMKKSAYLINIARGQIIDEQALIESLEQNIIAGAVLDVFDQEPLPAEHPFWNLANVILTPHISGRSPHYMSRALEIFEHNLTVYPEVTKLRNVIELERGY